MATFAVGDKVKIENARVYGLYCKRSSYIIKSGEFYIYNEKIRNNRIRLTDDPEKLGKPCMCTGWVSLNDLSLVEEPVEEVSPEEPNEQAEE